MRGAREAIALMSPQGCTGVEIGVATGQLTKRFLDLRHFGLFHAVDKWDDHHNEDEYNDVVELLSEYDNVTIHRTEAKQWLETVDDESLGFIYIDCYAKNGQEDGRLLSLAWPKLAEGGLFSGDDYSPVYPITVKAVDNFARERDLRVGVYDKHLNKLMCGEIKSDWDRSPSWYVRK